MKKGITKMVSSISSEHGSGSPKQLTLGILMSISSLMALLAKRASRASSKLKSAEPSRGRSRLQTLHASDSAKLPPRSPLARPKELLMQISNKAIALAHGNNKKRFNGEPEEDFGDGGVWQRAILMGDKCQPLDFSGVIYYDSTGKQLREVPLRSPRASPLPGFLTRGN